MTSKIKELVQINWKEIKEDTIIHYPEIKDLCYRSYPNHSKGCPNIDKCYHLNIPNFEILLEYGKFNHFYLVYAKFDFKKYKELRKSEHPNWTENQVKCVLYWQNSVKKQLIDYINVINFINKKAYILGCGSGMKFKKLPNYQKRVASMEHVCINVFSTMKLNGIKLEIIPKKIIYLICLICSQKQIKFNNKKTLDDF